MSSENIKKILKEAVYFILILGGGVCIYFITGIGCPIKKLTGIACPGCGMSRALMHAVILDYNAAFRYHPLFWVIPVIFAVILFRRLFKPKFIPKFLVAVLLLFIIVYFIRLVFTNDNIVSVNIKSGLIYKIFH